MMLNYVANKLSYDKNERLQFLSRRLGGLWLIWIGVVLVVSIYFGGEKLVQQTVFGLGYGLGLYLLFGLKPVRQSLSYGPTSIFQRKVTGYSIALMFILMVFIGGPHFAASDYRLEEMRIRAALWSFFYERKSWNWAGKRCYHFFPIRG